MTISVSPLIRGACITLALFLLAPGHALSGGQCPPEGAAARGPAQKTLRLFAKNPATWKIIPGGAKGLLSFDENTGRFTFTAEKLRPLKEYSLVRHSDGETLGDLLASGRTDRDGRLSLAGTWQTWRGKVWLVPTEVTAPSAGRLRLTAWRPKQVLFEEKVLGVAYPCNNRK